MAKRAWEIMQNPKNKRWYLQIFPNIALESYPTLLEIHDEAIVKGIDSYAIQADTILEKNLQRAREALGEELSFPMVIDPTFDARIILSADKVQAFLYIRKSADKNNRLEIKVISNLINTSRLKGMDAEKIKQSINSFRASSVMELQNFLIAEGTNPGRGKDRELISQFDWLSEEDTKKNYATLASFCKPGTINESSRIGRVIRGAYVYEFSATEPGTPGIDAYGNIIPGLPGNDPFLQIGENISISKTGLKAEKTGFLIVSASENGTNLHIVAYLDGIATPIVTPNNMTVSLILESEEGAGTHLSIATALNALSEKGIKGTIDTVLIEKTIAEVRATKKSQEIIVLRGFKSVRPGASRIIWKTNVNPETNTVNIYAGTEILSVEKVPAGADGQDVFGVQLKAIAAGIEVIPEHDETIIDEERNSMHTYLALKSGELRLSGNKLSISDTKEIAGDIDEKTGDIVFPGNLVLTGQIQSGRALKISGNLTITGDAGASLLSANESVTMNGGMRGGGKGTVWAKKTIQITFAENAHLLAGQDISVDNYCFQCTVKTNGRQLMKGNPAILLGGNIRASQGIEVFELGSEKTIRTSISFGQNYLIGDQIEVSEKEVKNIQESIKKIDAEMKAATSDNLRIQTLRAQKLEFLKRNEKLTVKIFMLKEQFETHIISNIKVNNIVYPGVILESHGRYFEVREQKCHVIFIFDQSSGQIICNSIETEE